MTPSLEGDTHVIFAASGNSGAGRSMPMTCLSKKAGDLLEDVARLGCGAGIC